MARQSKKSLKIFGGDQALVQRALQLVEAGTARVGTLRIDSIPSVAGEARLRHALRTACACTQ